ncbi:HAMP domain-containing protein [Paenibacillus sp. sptzw28]|uniref:sensor histidine kinase n=1 Tax=Paenibacillus sp. sptzw28 TaxID=715179 RepID=UPI001C6EEADE|nr:ATP-binding protein [Paenibacillus sp. sptzw28]QYR22357.1 HAMP domain-containing protein [Paenibacillus sp. sptzw28]
MTIRRKLFLAMAAIIVAMSVVFILLTQFVVKATLEHIRIADRTYEIDSLSKLFTDYYRKSGGTWENVQQAPAIKKRDHESPADTSYLLMSTEQKPLYQRGTADVEQITKLGIRTPLQLNGKTIALMYYHDPEVANLSIIQLGIGSSVSVLLLASSIVFTILSLLAAYWLSKRLTKPIRLLIPAIKSLGKGEFGIQAPIISKDEYATVARAFNDMSQQLQRAEDVRRNFVADVAHELRTPITILRGKLDLVQQSGRSIDPEMLLPLQDELIRLTRLVDDLYQLSLAEAKKLSIERKPTNVSPLLQRVIDRVSGDAQSKQIQIELDMETLSPTILIDPNRMTQVFMNLVINAVRYTRPGGSVTITVEYVPVHTGSADMLRVTVADTGPGIDAEHLPFIFNRFYRTDAARTRNSGGMGLGLAIAKEFVLAHNGTIEVESRFGQGTTFIIQLPITAE